MGRKAYKLSARAVQELRRLCGVQVLRLGREGYRTLSYQEIADELYLRKLTPERVDRAVIRRRARREGARP